MEFTGKGTTFYREGTTPDTFEEVAQIARVAPPQPERGTIEVEELNPPGGVKKKLADLIDAGEVTLILNFDPTNTGHLDLRDDFKAGTVRNYRIKLPMGYGWTFPAFVSAYQPQEIASSDVVQAEVKLTLAGDYEEGDIED